MIVAVLILTAFKTAASQWNATTASLDAMKPAARIFPVNLIVARKMNAVEGFVLDAMKAAARILPAWSFVVNKGSVMSQKKNAMTSVAPTVNAGASSAGHSIAMSQKKNATTSVAPTFFAEAPSAGQAIAMSQNKNAMKLVALTPLAGKPTVTHPRLGPRPILGPSPPPSPLPRPTKAAAQVLIRVSRQTPWFEWKTGLSREWQISKSMTWLPRAASLKVP